MGSIARLDHSACSRESSPAATDREEVDVVGWEVDVVGEFAKLWLSSNERPWRNWQTR